MKYQFEATIEVPDGTPYDDLEKFLRFELGVTSHLAGGNSLAKYDLESLKVTDFWLRGGA